MIATTRLINGAISREETSAVDRSRAAETFFGFVLVGRFILIGVASVTGTGSP
ncbi:MAG: hypothetical protein FWD69_19385 [Polyangiaceae bacterium]|nr:hypothetical protein [Polyangiaceae bacterium]